MTDGGAYIAGFAVIPDGPGRGWFTGFPGLGLRSAISLRPMIRAFDIAKKAGTWHELRAWIDTNSAENKRFAEAFGFKFDCGPATGFSPDGRDMDLYLWRTT